MNRMISIVLLALMSTAGLGGCANSRVVFDQPAARDAENVGLGFFSHDRAGARRDYLHADDFTVDDDCQLREVQWWGLVDGGPGDGLDNVASFAIALYDARANADVDPPARGPGQLITEWRFRVDETDPQPTGRYGSGIEGAGTSPEFRHAVILDPPMQLDAGTTYYLAISARLRDKQGLNWQWQDGVTTNGTSFSYFWKHGRWTRIEDTDSAVRLVRE